MSLLDELRSSKTTIKIDPNVTVEDAKEICNKLIEDDKTYYIVCLDFYVSRWGNREASN